MKKYLLIALIAVVTIASALLCGCRAINQAPGVTPLATILPTLPAATPMDQTSPAGLPDQTPANQQQTNPDTNPIMPDATP